MLQNKQYSYHHKNADHQVINVKFLPNEFILLNKFLDYNEYLSAPHANQIPSKINACIYIKKLAFFVLLTCYTFC